MTKGVVSRVEPTQYAHGAAQLMAIQIDAAINPGNSGGPAIMGDKVAGVAFQNLSGAENIGLVSLQVHFLSPFCFSKNLHEAPTLSRSCIYPPFYLMSQSLAWIFSL